MTRRNSTAGMIDRFTYMPGDGHRYALRGDVIVIERIRQGAAGMTFVPTGDTILAPASRTATALMAAIDRWRAGRVTGEDVPTVADGQEP